MNRNEELRQLLESMEKDVPELGGSIVKAYKRRRRKRAVYHSFAGVAVICCLFVLLVNVYEPFAQLCAQTPVLKTLAASVTVEHTWPDEVEEDDAQQEEKGTSILLNKYVEASVEGISLEKSVATIALKINSNAYTDMIAWVEVSASNVLARPDYNESSFAVKNGEVFTFEIDYSKTGMPNNIPFQLFIQYEDDSAESFLGQSGVWADNYIDFEFDINSKAKTVKSYNRYYETAYKAYPINQLIDMDGHQMLLTNAVMLSSQIKIEVIQSKDNTTTVKDIYAYTKNMEGKLSELDANADQIILTVYNLIDVHGKLGSVDLSSVDTDAIDLIIKGARMLDPKRERVYVNLLTGETEKLPDGVELYRTYKEDGTWVVEMRTACRISEDETLSPQEFEIMNTVFYDADGNRYNVDHKSGYFDDYYRGVGYTHIEELELEDYPYDEVWLEMEFSHVWEPENEVVYTFVQ